jgi:putative oxidoreductase
MEGIGRLVMRATIGGYFVGHGLQKLTGWFGGDGPEETGEFFESVGIRPGRKQALLAGATEMGGGTLLALGFLTPLGVAAVAGVMTNAIGHVHAKNGLWITNGGVELPMTIIAALAALAESGPGPLSLDAKYGIELKGRVVMGLALGAGAAAALYVVERGEKLFDRADADAALSRAMEYVGTER